MVFRGRLELWELEQVLHDLEEASVLQLWFRFFLLSRLRSSSSVAEEELCERLPRACDCCGGRLWLNLRLDRSRLQKLLELCRAGAKSWFLISLHYKSSR